VRATHNRSPKQSKRDPAITVQTDTTVVLPHHARTPAYPWTPARTPMND
jgi:hypothetical protein